MIMIDLTMMIKLIMRTIMANLLILKNRMPMHIYLIIVVLMRACTRPWLL